jgi:predicted nucleic acid-binding protein
VSLLLDTNVISELRRPDLAQKSFRDWADETLPSPAACAVSSITLFEIERGILLAERRNRPEAPVLRDWFTLRVVPEYADACLPVTASIALLAADYALRGTPPTDALIAATAAVHNLTLVTRNTRDFAPLGIPLLNPWAPRPT